MLSLSLLAEPPNGVVLSVRGSHGRDFREGIAQGLGRKTPVRVVAPAGFPEEASDEGASKDAGTTIAGRHCGPTDAGVVYMLVGEDGKDASIWVWAIPCRAGESFVKTFDVKRFNRRKVKRATRQVSKDLKGWLEVLASESPPASEGQEGEPASPSSGDDTNEAEQEVSSAEGEDQKAEEGGQKAEGEGEAEAADDAAQAAEAPPEKTKSKAKAKGKGKRKGRKKGG